MKVPKLKYNPQTIPEIIWNYFCSKGYYESSFGNLLPPFMIKIIREEKGVSYGFYPLEKYYEFFSLLLKKGRIYNKKGEKLNSKTIDEYLISYAKGFENGYYKYEQTLNKTEPFSLTNEILAYKIFERVYGTFNIKDGNIGAVIGGKDESGNSIMYITNELFYKKGYEGGEYYKAWELILSYPTLFKPLFNSMIKPSKHQRPENPELEAKTQRLKKKLNEYGFFNLKLVTEIDKDKLISLLVESNLPYQIAMLDYLGFLKHLGKEYSCTKAELYKLVSDILNTPERPVKGNILVLNPISKENKKRYTAHLTKEKAENDYYKLK